MEYVDFNPLASGPIARPFPQQPVASFGAGEVLGASFRRQNDLVNLGAWALSGLREPFAPDPQFDVISTLNADELRFDYGEQLARAQSQPEYDDIRARILREQRDRQIMASAGFGGFVAETVAGALSPTSLVPLIGPARGIKGAAQSFALAAAAVGAQEAALYGLQETRTAEEALVGVAVGTVIGGLLGTAVRFATPEGMGRLEFGMAGSPGEGTILIPGGENLVFPLIDVRAKWMDTYTSRFEEMKGTELGDSLEAVSQAHFGHPEYLTALGIEDMDQLRRVLDGGEFAPDNASIARALELEEVNPFEGLRSRYEFATEFEQRIAGSKALDEEAGRIADDLLQGGGDDILARLKDEWGLENLILQVVQETEGADTLFAPTAYDGFEARLEGELKDFGTVVAGWKQYLTASKNSLDPDKVREAIVNRVKEDLEFSVGMIARNLADSIHTKRVGAKNAAKRFNLDNEIEALGGRRNPKSAEKLERRLDDDLPADMVARVMEVMGSATQRDYKSKLQQALNSLGVGSTQFADKLADAMDAAGGFFPIGDSAQGGLVFMSPVADELRAFVSGMFENFGLGGRHVEVWDIAELRKKTIVELKALGTSAIKKGTRGFVQPVQLPDGTWKYLLAIDVNKVRRAQGIKSVALQAEVIAHEFGHILHFLKFAEMLPAERAAILSSWVKFATASGSLAAKYLRRAPAGGFSDMRIRHSFPLRDTRELLGVKFSNFGFDTDVYHFSFEEWFADNVARSISTASSTGGTLERVFGKLAEAWRRFAAWLRGRDYVDPEVDEFLQSLSASWRMRDIQVPERKVEVPEVAPVKPLGEDGALGAASARDVQFGLMKPGPIRGAAISALAKLNPVTRLIENKLSPSARYWINQIFSPGLRVVGDEGGSLTTAGTVFDRVNVHGRAVSDFILELDDAYARHVATGPLPEGRIKHAWLQNIKSNLNLVPEGRLKFPEFSEAAFDVANTGKAHPDEFVNAAAAAMKKYFAYADGLADEAFAYRQRFDGDGAKPLYDKLEFKESGDIVAYVHHLYDKRVIQENATGFLRDLTEHGLKIAQGAWEASFARFSKQRFSMQAMVRALKVDDAGLSKLLQDNEVEIKSLRAQIQPGLDRIKQLKESLRAQGADPKEISEAVKQLEATFGDDYYVVKTRIKQVEKDSAIFRTAGAGVPERLTRLLETAAKMDELQMTELKRLAAAGVRMQKAVAKLDPKVVAAEQEKLRKLVEEASRKYSKAQERAKKFLAQNGLEKYETANAQATAHLETLNKRLAKLAASESMDWDEARQLLADSQNDFVARIKELNARRAVREAEAIKEAKTLDPAVRAEKKAAALKEAEAQLANLEAVFRDRWERRGADNINLNSGTMDFMRQAGRDATELLRRILGQANRVVGLDILGAERGPELQRTLNLPYAIKRKYLVRDAEKIVRTHAHSFLPDVEMYRATGSVNGQRIFDEMNDDFRRELQRLEGATHLYRGKAYAEAELTPEELGKAKPLTPAMLEKLNRELVDQNKAITRDMMGVIDRLRHSRGIPEDGDAFGYRLGRAAMNINVFRYMGMVVNSSLPDLARPVFRYGMSKTFKHAWAPLIRDLKRVKHTRAEAMRFGVALDPLLHNRPQAVFDIGENYASRQTLAERGLEFLANKTGLVALFDRYTAEMKHLANNVTFAELGEAFRKVGEGELDDNARGMLRYAGIDDEMAERIWAQYQLPGGSEVFEGGVYLPNTENWVDSEAAMAIAAGVNKIANDLIVTPGLDRPLWMDANMGFKLLAQFRSFTFTSTNRILMSGLQEADMAYMQGMVFSLALGGFSYYTWAVISGGDTYDRVMKEDAGQWVYEAVGRSGVLGVLSEGQKIGEQLPLLNDLAIFGGEGRNSRRASSLMGAVVGPSYDLAERLAAVAQGLDSPTQSTLHNARTALVPYQNVFYLRRLFDAMEQGTADLFNIPERRE